MTTIFTDDFAYEQTEITVGDEPLGEKGQELIFATESEREFRIKLSTEQMHELADALLLAGFEQKAI